MANNISPALLAEIFAQESGDPFLTLVTLSHESFDNDVLLVNNSRSITSRGLVFEAFPMKIRLPVDDGEAVRDFTLELDNVSLELVGKIRSVTTQIGVKVEMILASMPDVVQMEQADLAIASISYNSRRLSARVLLDSFLNVALTSETYGPSNFPGLF